MDYAAIGKRIKELRVKNNYTQGQLAKATGLSPAHISNIETAHTKVSLSSVIDIADVLNVSVDELVCEGISPLTDVHAKSIYASLRDCTENEMELISEMIKVIKKSLRNTDNDCE